MNKQNQTVAQVTSHMAAVLAKYLDPSEVDELTTLWRHQPAISVKMMQQSILDTTRRYPHLKPYKSEIRKGFWAALYKNAVDKETDTEAESTTNDLNKQQISTAPTVSAQVAAFYSVIENIKSLLSAPDDRNFLSNLHQNIRRERTFKAHAIDVQKFLYNERPEVPDDVFILNNLVQLAYVCLCDVVGPVEADEVMYRSAEQAKQIHPKALVESLF
jgi:hypothetical protein